VQNNRTMLLASVSQDIQSNGRAGLPILGGLPLLGRLFTTPTRENRQVDIVIAVTPRVLRAPAVTPRDLEMRPSGTLSNPTLGSLADMIREADREDQIAAAKAQNNRASAVPQPTTAPASANNAVQTQKTTSEQVPSYVPAPKSLINDKGVDVAAVNTGAVALTNASLTISPKPIDPAVESSASRVAQLKLMTGDAALKVGEKRRVALELKSDVPFPLAVLMLRFDPRVIAVQGITAGTMLVDSQDALARVSPSIDPSGLCMISISAISNVAPIKGAGVLLFIDIEAVRAGNSGLAFDKDKSNLMGSDGREVGLALSQGQITVKR
jgi:hypothetical protein